MYFIVLMFFFSCTKNENINREVADYPAWVQDAVFYQIFPERYSNGDQGNDPDIPSLKGSWPHIEVENWQISPWVSDWYKLQPWEESNGLGFEHNVQLRRYGGDIQGIINKLDYLNELGITAIYLNPVFESPSLHKYDATCYHHIDNNFGPDPNRDRQIISGENPDDPSTWQWTTADSLFLNLIKEAHKKNIKIIIDGVFNHVGMTFWAFKDVVKNESNSKYKDWFTVKSWDNPETAENEFDYAGWVGIRELPELREDENGLVEPVKDHVFAVIERWMDPNNDGNPEDGIDGWRLDVAEMVSHNFWKDFRKKVKSINSDAYITGEIFWDDWTNNKMMDPEPWLRGDEFDGVMNYRWSAALTNYFIDKKNKISSKEFFSRLESLDKSYPDRTRFTLLNLMDSHDTDRIASNIINPDLFYDKYVGVKDNPTYIVRKPNEKEVKIQKLIALFQFTYPGAPMIYYGTESGMWGGDDPDERKPMVWPDIEYENEIANLSDVPRPSDEVKFDSLLYNYYKKLIQIRKEENALRRGSFQPINLHISKDVIAYRKLFENERILVVINNENEPVSIKVPDVQGDKWLDLLNNSELLAKNQELKIKLDEKSGVVLKNKK